MVVSPGEPRTLGPRDDESTVPLRPRAGRGAVLALLAGVVAVVASLVLPFAPVSQNEPQVSWPNDPSAPTSTMLMLTAYRPLSIEAAFSCRLADQVVPPERVVLATTRPDSSTGVSDGLLVTVTDGVLTMSSRGVEVVREPLGTTACRFTVAGQGDTVVVSRDGRELGRGPMPDVDALTTSVTTLPGATPDDVSVRLTVDDRFSTSPAPTKVALLVILALAVGLAVGCLALVDRRTVRARPRENRAPVALAGRLLRGAVDAAVVVTLLVWLVVAPLTPDDGYYSAMATNTPFEGYVGNYYQVYNQGFTPFTWIYQALAWWQQLVGLAPVAQRVPAVVCGLLTWVCVRALLHLRGLDDPRTVSPPSRRDLLTAAVGGVCFLAWWMPFDLGVRPEPVIALAATACLLCVLLAARRRSLVLAGAAVGIASLGATTSPSGLVALAPLIAGAPTLWSIVRRDGDRLATTARLACVLAPGGVGAAAAFADGSLGDFLRAQQLLYGVQDFESWYTEYKRWASVLAPDAPYAIRPALLVTVLALVAFTALWAAGKARGRGLPEPLVVAAATVVVGFVLLAPTPSKPWMHFGAVAGVGAVLVTLMIVDGPRVLRGATEGRRLPRGPVVLSVVGVVLTLALAGHGINRWWLSSWSPGMPHADTSPQVWIVRFDQPVWWLVGVLVIAAAAVLVASRTDATWRPYATVLALCSIVVVFLAGNVAYLVGTFGLQAVRTGDSWSIPGDTLRDPLARRCSAGSQIEAADPAGRPLVADPRAPAATPGTGFAPLGWPADNPPPVPPLSPGTTGWGSLVTDPDDAGAQPDARTGEMATPWLALPTVPADQAVTALVAGSTGDGTSLAAEYGQLSPTGVAVLESRQLGQPADPSRAVSSSAWRSVDLAGQGSPPPPGTEMVRLVARDDRSDLGGWIAFTSPRLSRFVPIADIVGDGAPTSVYWPVALLFPCVRQPRIENGITEPAMWAIGAYADPLDVLVDGTWQTGRGGVSGQAGRQARITQLLARFPTAPVIEEVQLYRMQEPYPSDAYRLVPGRRIVSGWSTG